MRYKEADVGRINTEYNVALRSANSVFWRLLERSYRTERGKEFAHQGIARRAKFMLRIMERVFSIAPPSRTQPLSEDEGIDLEINLHAFLMATYGSLDNLAWLWICENQIENKRGGQIHKSMVGLRKGNTFVRGTLPQGLADKLALWDGWLEGVEDYRDALAHRIPPYVARLSVLMDNAPRYGELHELRRRAILSHDLVGRKAIEKELEGLEAFMPVMQHSWGENAAPVRFHASIIVDTKSVSELTGDFLDALDHVTQEIE